MKNPAENNKRVAKNTLFLYFRMILIMLVTLYTSRGVLAELGIDDYGIYNVVGGVVLMFSFLNSCMSTATQRFLTFELGRGDTDKLKNVFAAALNIHIAIGILIIFLAETIGLWFVYEKLASTTLCELTSIRPYVFRRNAGMTGRLTKLSVINGSISIGMPQS